MPASFKPEVTHTVTYRHNGYRVDVTRQNKPGQPPEFTMYLGKGDPLKGITDPDKEKLSPFPRELSLMQEHVDLWENVKDAVDPTKALQSVKVKLRSGKEAPLMHDQNGKPNSLSIGLVHANNADLIRHALENYTKDLPPL